MNKKILFAALFLAALSIGFIACDNDDDPRLDNDDDNTENVVDGDSINNIEGEDDYYNCDSTEMVCTGKAYDITGTTAKVAATVHIPLTLLAQCQLGVQVSSSKEDLIAHENVTNFTSKNLTGNDFVVNLKDLKSGATTYYYCAYIYLNGIYHYGLIREFKTFCVLTIERSGGFSSCTATGSGEYAYGAEAAISATFGEYSYFKYWSDCDSKELTRTVMVTSDSTIIAHFAKKTYLAVGANISSYGTVSSSSGYYMPGDEVTITATPKFGFKFVKWSDGNTDNPRTITINDKDLYYNAIFEAPIVVSGTENGCDYVDLGLPSGLKWATHNVSDCCAWGDSNNGFSWYSYKWSNGESDYITKYCTDSDDGIVDNKTVLDPEDDKATRLMGGSWRMPTYDEFKELKTECTWTTNYNSTAKSGYIVVGKNGNHIFLPALGYKTSNISKGNGDYGYYWSSSLHSYDSRYAYSLYFNSDDVYVTAFWRYLGYSVRGVCP